MESYDVIVVGGGSAGSVVARRLSDDGRMKVLLLEAGEIPHGDEVPAALRSRNFFFTFTQPDFFWPELRGRLTADKEPEHYLVGRGLGGSSAVNAMLYVRPPLADFDRWERLGCSGWSGQEVLDAFRRAERDLDFGSRAYHGDAGPMPVVRPQRREWKPLDRAFYAAAKACGHPETPEMDFNAPQVTGISTVPYHVSGGKRVSASDAYLGPVRDRENLTIVGATTVDTVRFEGRRAVGVTAIQNRTSIRFAAPRIVLCAGAVFTPAILCRSGIGPGAVIDRIGAPRVSRREGLGRIVDHPLLTVTFRLKRPFQAPPPAPNDFFSSIIVTWTSDTPEGMTNDLNVHTQSFIGSTRDALEQGGLVMGLGSIYSSGRLAIESLDPLKPPFVEVNMLSDDRDLVRVRQGIRHLFDLVRDPAMAEAIEGDPMLAPRGKPGKPAEAFATDDELDREIRTQCAQYFHPVGTCRMGDPHDRASVIDPAGRIIGTDGLFVADASVMPEIVRCNTLSTTLMIAERIAEHVAAG